MSIESQPSRLGLPLRVAIAAEEPGTRERLRKVVSVCDEVVLVAETGDGRGVIDAVVAAERGGAPVDVLLLEVDLPGLSGFDVVSALPCGWRPSVVFMAAQEGYAVQAIDCHAVGYLVEPFDDGRLAVAVERARAHAETRRLALLGRQAAAIVGAGPLGLVGPGGRHPAPSYPARLAVRTGGRVDFVRVDEVDWIRGGGAYAQLHVGARAHLLRMSLARLEERLPPRRFVRIHRSAIVNVDRVRALEHLSRGAYAVHLEDGTELKLSRSYRDRLDDLLGPDLP